MENNLKMLEIVERIRKTQKDQALATPNHLQTKTENGQKGNFSKTCSLCDDTTWIEGIVDKRTCAYRCECYEKDRLNNANGWKKAGLTLETSKLNFKSFENWNENSKAMKDLAIQYFKSFDEIKEVRKNSLMLSGNPGCGKTHLVIAIANNLIRRRVNVVYMPYREIIMEIKQNILNGQIYSEMLDKYKKAEVLLIDDLFKGQITKSDTNIIFEIINYRYMSNLPMLISTELTIEEIIEIDEGLGSRIYEMVSDYKAEVIGTKNNYRLKDKKQKNSN